MAVLDPSRVRSLRRDEFDLMAGRRRFLSLILVMFAVTTAAISIALWSLYGAAFEQQRDRLIESAQSSARLIEAIARHEIQEQIYPGFHNCAPGHEEPLAAAMSRIRDAHSRFRGFGDTGEFTLARRRGDQIVFLLSHRHYDLDQLRPVPFDGRDAEPMRSALSGLSGTMIGRDYRGERVLAAFEPIAILDAGIVAKIDLEEIRAPFVRAGSVAAGVGVLFVSLGAAIFLRIGNPVLRRLHSSERRYRGLFESAVDMLLLIDSKGHVLDANPSACSSLGYPREELIGSAAGDLISADHRAPFSDALTATAQHSSMPISSVSLHRDGGTLEIEGHLSRMQHEATDAILLAARDVSERKRTEDALRQRTVELGERVKELRCLYGISRLAVQAGLSLPEMLERTVALIPPAWRWPERTCAQITIEQDSFRSPEFVVTDLCLESEIVVDESRLGVVQVYLRENPLADEEPFLAEEEDLIAAVSERIAEFIERKRTEAALRDERDNLAILLGSMDDGVYIVDRDYRLRYTNPALQRQFGDPGGRLCYEYLMGRSSPCESCTNDNVFDGATVRWEWSVERTGKTYDALGTPVRQPDGEICKLEILRDITERKESESKLTELNVNLERRVADRTAELETRAVQLRRLAVQLTGAEERERQRLARLLHDDLQQILYAVKLNLGNLRTSCAREAEVEAPTARIQRLIDQAIDASRSLTIELSPPILSVGTLREILEWLASWTREQHGLAVTVETGSEEVFVEEDARITIFQTVRELLFNVAKHAQVGHAHVRASDSEGDRLEIVVSDHGIGFESGGAQPGDASPEGFGLFRIRERLESLGGGLDLESTPGQGTRATLTLPASVTRPGATPAARTVEGTTLHPTGNRTSAPGVTLPGAKITVMVVDDHPIARAGLKTLLGRAPDLEIVAEAEDGQAALEIACRVRPHVVVMDVNMPRLGGVEATRQMLADHPEACVIGVSMDPTAAVAAALYDAGAFACLDKSGPPEALIDAIRRAVIRT